MAAAGEVSKLGSWRVLAGLDPVPAYVDMFALPTVIVITDAVELLSSALSPASRSASSLPFELDMIREVIAATVEVLELGSCGIY